MRYPAGVRPKYRCARTTTDLVAHRDRRVQPLGDGQCLATARLLPGLGRIHRHPRSDVEPAVTAAQVLAFGARAEAGVEAVARRSDQQALATGGQRGTEARSVVVVRLRWKLQRIRI